MLTQKARERTLLLSLLDAFLLWLAFVLAFWARLLAPEVLIGRASPIEFSVHIWSVLVAIPVFLGLASAAGLYRGEAAAGGIRVFVGLAKVFATVATILGLAIFLFQAQSFSRAVFGMFLAGGFLLVAGGRWLAGRIGRRIDWQPSELRNVLIVGLNPEGRAIRMKLASRADLGMRVAGYLAADGELPDGSEDAPVLGSLSDLRAIVSERVVDEVVFALPLGGLLACEEAIRWCEEIGATVHIKMDFVRTLLSRTYPSELDGVPMLTLASTPRDPLVLATKRTLDVVVSASALVLLAPVMALCALVVRLTSSGPVLFRQSRVGLNGRAFTLYKFRSMRSGAEQMKKGLEDRNEMSGPVFKMRHDPRVTAAGHWLRKFSLDELPQLWNVLKGDLSLVGPRPPTPDEVRQYERWQRRRLSVKPGVTCLWQVSGRSAIDFADWMRLDLAYIDNWSLRLDLEILVRTIPAVLFAKGAR